MKVGTKSVLFGAHCWFIHPLFLFIAWWKLFGFPKNPRLWVAFLVHDWGYWGKEKMDDEDGERHVILGANIMRSLFETDTSWVYDDMLWGWVKSNKVRMNRFWYFFCLCHSRHYSKIVGIQYSPLCVADKLATALEPKWLYIPRVILSGEVKEYMEYASNVGGSKYKGEGHDDYITSELSKGTLIGWHNGMTTYLKKWAYAHKDGKKDSWTSNRGKDVESATL